MSATTRDEQWWWDFAVAVRNAVLRECSPNSCVESVRVASAVGRYFGVPVTPIAVSVGVHTADRWQAQSGPGPAPDPLPGWSVGVSGSGTMNMARLRWDGHLVAVCDGHMFIDFSADQFNRPERGLVVPGPVVVPADTRRVRLGMAVADEQNGTVYHVRATGDRRWRDFPAWVARPKNARKMAADAITTLTDTPAQSVRNG